MKKPKGWREFIRLVQQTKPSLLLMVIALLLSVSTTGVGLLVPLFTKNLINDFSLSSLSPERIVLVVAAIFIQALASGLSICFLITSVNRLLPGLGTACGKSFLFCLSANMMSTNLVKPSAG